MDFNALPFNADDMISGLQPWVECESPTHNAAAVERMLDLAAYDLVASGASIERIPGRGGFAGCVRATFPHKAQGQPGILIAGHMDTVHPLGTLEQLPFRSEGNQCWGPGIQDMKSGNYLALDAIRQLQRAGVETPLPVTVLFTPDEEVGTPSCREIIEATAATQKYVLVPEPARPDGGATWGRYAIARYYVETRGVPVHAGVDPRLGKSAIAEMARRIGDIESMTDDHCTFSVGIINGGQWVNCVASSCHAEVLSMARRQTDLDRGVEKMLALNDTQSDVQTIVTRNVTRPVWEPDHACKALHQHAQSLARDLGFELPAAMSGGGSDGNFTGAMGIATLDSLGVRGAGLHTLNEHIEVDSLPERGKLMAALLATLK
ncbi:MAG: M20/M25/M40 family metallo-hydrolase [Pseudomonadota bacterium]